MLPELRVSLVTSDTIFSPARAAALVASVEGGEVDVLIGTQLVTKGYHFPELTLVGVVDADLGLAGGDLRAGERTFQQIAQVAGRAGRGAKPGRVLLQTAPARGADHAGRWSSMTPRASMRRKPTRGATSACRRSAGSPASSCWARTTRR